MLNCLLLFGAFEMSDAEIVERLQRMGVVATRDHLRDFYYAALANAKERTGPKKKA